MSRLVVRVIAKLPLLVLLVFLGPKPGWSATGYLHITSQPDQAKVSVLGPKRVEGTTPFRGELPVGTYTVTVSKDSMVSVQRTVVVREDRVERIHLQMEPASLGRVVPMDREKVKRELGSLSIITDVDGARVTIDGHTIPDLTPFTIEDISAGAHDVTVEHGGRIIHRRVTVGARRVTKLQLSFAAEERARQQDRRLEEERVRTAIERQSLSVAGDLSGNWRLKHTQGRPHFTINQAMTVQISTEDKRATLTFRNAGGAYASAPLSVQSSSSNMLAFQYVDSGELSYSCGGPTGQRNLSSSGDPVSGTLSRIDKDTVRFSIVRLSKCGERITEELALEKVP
jgi:hypothetical protein